MATAEQGVSLAPGAFVKGGGLIDDVDATIQESRFVEYDYNGKIQQPVLSLHLKLVTDDGEEHDQYYSAGDLKHFVPSNDGRYAVPTGTKTGLNDNSNMFMLITSLINAGLPEEKLADGDVSALEGLRAHWQRVPQPKRSGLPSQANQGQGAREATVLVVSKILEGAKGKAAKGKAAAASRPNGQAGKATPATPSTPASSVDDEALTALLMGVISEKGGSIAKKDVAGLVFKAATDYDAKTKALLAKRAFDDDFLGADDQPWTYDGATISL